MNILWAVESPQAATTRYRVVVPARPLLKMGWRIDIVDRLKWPLEPFPYDAVCFQRNSTPDTLLLLRELEKKGIPTLYDVDDDLFSIETTSPVFDLYLKRPDVPWHQLMAMRFCRSLTVSTKQLQFVYSPLNLKSKVLPNFIDLREWDNVKFPAMCWGDDRVVLLWAGSGTHLGSLALMTDALGNVLRKYPQAILVLMGLDACPFPRLPRAQLAMFGWSVYANYQSILRSADIGLAPLAPSQFNKAKSDLRIKEYASAGLAIVGSPFCEYTESISGAGGFLCKNPEQWTEALSLLIEDAVERKRRKEQAREWVKRWDIGQPENAVQWQVVFEQMKDPENAHDFLAAPPPIQVIPESEAVQPEQSASE
jgi:glycosyltransferase involved in cell wall biosynthesis